MATQRSCLLSLLCLMLLQQSLSIRIENRPRGSPNRPATTNSTAKPSVPVYRISRPEPKQPEKRVPAHLQDVRPGYVDDDAGDVIRIIEPPAHFQQLKRLRQRQTQAQPHAPHAPHAPLATIAPQTAVVWEQPRKLSTNRAPPRANGDLLTQETQFSPQITNNLQLPMEILASVRKTERLLQRQRQKKLPLPVVRQRHIQRQSHTLIAQKSLEQQLYQRGQQQRLRAALTQDQDHKRSKRVKREAKAEETGEKTEGEQRYDVAQGLKLVAHIGALLENATRYLPDELEMNQLAPKSVCGNATNCDSRRRRQRLFKLQGSKKSAAKGRNFRHEASNTTTTTTTTTSVTTTTTATSTPVTSATPLASRLVNSRKSPNNRNQQQQQQQQLLPLSSPRRDDSVLYADVMSTIRNLWQEHDHDHDLSLAPQFVAPEQVANNTDYRVLNVYLRELDEISKRLPTVAPITALNREEFARVTPSPNWYLINNEGKIYETRLDSKTKPTAELFHRFPDMPDGNESVLTPDLE
ncbi:hypothetical protein ACLKA6_011896 [Drosophila palustris]